MRIDVVTETFPPEVNGVAMTIGRLVAALRRKGHGVSVLHVGKPSALPAEGGAAVSAESAEVRLPGLPMPGYPGVRFGLPAGRRLARRWQAERPDLVHVVTEGPLGWSAISAARRLGIPVTSGYHTHFDAYSDCYRLGWLRPLLTAYLDALHRRALATFVPAGELVPELVERGIPNVEVVGRGVDTWLFSPERRCERLRRSWKPDGPPPFVCLYVGRLAAEKNLLLAAEAFESVRILRPEARMVWVGDGPARAGLVARYPHHHFAGVQRGLALAEHYASADAFLFPSLTETWGNVVPEAMASALPVVAFNRAAAQALIVDGHHGCLATVGDEADFVACAMNLATHPARAVGMGLAACQQVSMLSWERVADTFEAALVRFAQPLEVAVPA